MEGKTFKIRHMPFTWKGLLFSTFRGVLNVAHWSRWFWTLCFVQVRDVIKNKTKVSRMWGSALNCVSNSDWDHLGMETWGLLAVGVVVHAFLMISIFDIYFSTPLIGGQGSHVSSLPPPAKRVIFIVADGLRADKLLMLQPDGNTPAPFTRYRKGNSS